MTMITERKKMNESKGSDGFGKEHFNPAANPSYDYMADCKPVEMCNELKVSKTGVPTFSKSEMNFDKIKG